MLKKTGSLDLLSENCDEDDGECDDGDADGDKYIVRS